MRFVPVKDEEQQANGVVFRARDLLVRQRTQCINALRGHLAEYGYVFPQGHRARRRPWSPSSRTRQSSVPESARTILKVLDRHLQRTWRSRSSSWMPRSPGGQGRPVGAPADDDPGHRPDRRDGDHGPGAGAGGLPRRAGLRRLAWADAAAEVDRRQAEARGHLEDGRADDPAPADHRRQRGGRRASRRGAPKGSWLARMLARKPRMLVTVALANKMARIVWALLVKGGTYRAPAAAA